MWYKNNRATSGAVNGFTEYKEELMLERFKARLVAKGAEQRGRSRFHRHFQPCPTSVRVVLTIALSFGWPLHQLDVNNAFLHGDLEEPVYMLQPPGLTDPTYPQHVCKLRKALYGLKQAPRAWYNKFQTCLQSLGFHSSQCFALPYSSSSWYETFLKARIL